MKKRRVVVTGLGALTPIGNSARELWDGLLEGKNGIDLITKFDASNFETKFAAEVKGFDPENYLDKKSIKRMDPFTQYALVTAEMALNDAKLNFNHVDKDKFGVIYGSGIGGMITNQQQHFNYYENKNPRQISPFFVTMMISDIAAGQISIKYGLKGPNYATTSACATSSHAIADAFILIQRGSADLMVCGNNRNGNRRFQCNESSFQMERQI